MIGEFYPTLPFTKRNALESQPHIRELQMLFKQETPMDEGIIALNYLIPRGVGYSVSLEIYIRPDGEIEPESDGPYRYPALIRMEDDGHYHFYEPEVNFDF